MSETRNKFYLTTPIYYVNARPHIGHAYSTIAADVVARRHRLLGDDTFFLTGTDEHGQKIQRAALAAGVPPQQYADQVSATFRDLWKRMGITNDDYIRTTDARHVEGVQKLWRELEARGAIYLSTYTGQYSVGEEMFVDGPPGTIGPDGKPTETVTEENYFFRLSDYQLPLIDLIESGQLHIQPETTRNEVLSFLRGNVSTDPGGPSSTGGPIAGQAGGPGERSLLAGVERGLSGEARPLSALGNPYAPGALKDLSISRTTFDWGIPVPGNPKHVIYVWLDALANYMTAVGYGSDDPAEQAKFKRYWPADLHLVGKEITRFHCVYWPAFLLALNPNSVALDPEGHRFSSETGPATAATPEGHRFSFETARATAANPEGHRFSFETGPATAANPEGHGFSRAEDSRVEDATALPKAVSFDRAWAERWLPKSVVANGWLLFEESKMSKSRGNVVRTETILDAFGPLCPPVPAGGSSGPQPAESASLKGTGFSPSVTNAQSDAALAAEGASTEPLRPPTKAEQDLFAADVLRYYLLREIPFGQDGSFSFDALITRYNADLANGYGNLVSRTLSMIGKYFASTIPASPFASVVKDLPLELDANGKPKTNLGYGTELYRDAFEVNLDAIGRDRQWHLFGWLFIVAINIAHCDTYLTRQAPWKLSSSEGDDAKRAEILYTAAESIRILTALLYPILPYATASVWRQLGLGSIEEAARNGELKNLQWGGLKPGTKLGPLAPIFPRADKGLAQIMTDMESPATPALTPTESVKSAVSPSPAPSTESVASAPSVLSSSPTPASETISIDDFAKVDLRVAQIVVAERIPKADKLLRLEVDLGPNFNPSRRQILAGIAEYYAPETLIGRKVVIVANLAPRKMRGLESNGMIVAASIGPAGAPVLAGFLEDVELGARLK